MCGFCGILNLDGAPVPHDVLAAMNVTLIHRGQRIRTLLTFEWWFRLCIDPSTRTAP